VIRPERRLLFETAKASVRLRMGQGHLVDVLPSGDLPVDMEVLTRTSMTSRRYARRCNDAVDNDTPAARCAPAGPLTAR
jgi:hypothetical protein